MTYRVTLGLCVIMCGCCTNVTPDRESQPGTFSEALRGVANAVRSYRVARGAFPTGGVDYARDVAEQSNWVRKMDFFRTRGIHTYFADEWDQAIRLVVVSDEHAYVYSNGPDTVDQGGTRDDIVVHIRIE